MEAVAHLFEVAAGLQSQLIGETEIFGQVKDAYAEACAEKTVGQSLHRLFQKTFQAGKWARTHTAISQGQVSLGNVAVELAARVFGSLKHSHGLVVGGGEIGRDVAKALHSRGLKKISVTSRRAESATSVASEVEGEVIDFKEWQTLLSKADVAVFATAAPTMHLTKAELTSLMKKRGGDPLLLIDLAMPRDVDPACADLDSVFLYDLADLSEIANTNRRIRESEISVCRDGLRQRADAFATRFLRS
jgi:glutamyl-tRNA reductase